MDFEEADAFSDALAKRLSGPLPGRAAHRRFLPDLSFGRYYIPPPIDARHAAVIALLYPDDHGDWRLPLTLRPAHLKDHAGQVSFPGGAIENDETIEEAALRELHEELDVAAEEVRVLGRLTSIYLYASGFYVTPVVAVCANRPAMVPSPDEVAELLEVPISVLLDKTNYGRHIREFGDQSRVKIEAGDIQFQSHRIWGATAIMLSELIEMLRT